MRIHQISKKQMKKIFLISGLFLVILTLAGCSNNPESVSNANSNLNQNQTTTGVPTRGAELSGVVSSIEGNEIVLKNEIGREILNEEQMAQKKAERQKMSETERQALRNAETQGMKTEDIKLTVPVGVPIFKGTGQTIGEIIKVDLGEIKKGSYISVWKNGEQIEAIKIKGNN